MSTVLLSKTTEKELATLQKIAEKGELLEMRDRNGLLLAVGNSLYALQNFKSKDGKHLYKVEIKKILKYDKIEELVVYDIQLGIYKGKKIMKHKNQDFFNKQEDYWLKAANMFWNSDRIPNSIVNKKNL